MWKIKNVVTGEDQDGISKSVNWNGGGSFIYCELLEQNSKLITDINNSSEKNIMEIYNKIINSSFALNYKIDPEKLKSVKILNCLKS